MCQTIVFYLTMCSILHQVTLQADRYTGDIGWCIHINRIQALQILRSPYPNFIIFQRIKYKFQCWQKHLPCR
jgi:hypothetical protein